LHHAAWFGKAELVRELLELGADATPSSEAEFSTPLAWAVLASRDHELPDRDFVGVAELLTGAGAEIEPRFLEVAEGPLLEWLEGAVD
jgi:ankyrin repeat protein